MLPIYEIPPPIPTMFSPSMDCFSTQEQEVHFLRSMTGLVLPFSGKATVDGINTLFCGDLARNQSSTNRFLTDSGWDHTGLAPRRVELVQQHPLLRPGAKGVMAIDDVLLEKTGQHSDGGDDLFDPTQKKDILCHCLVSCSYNTLGQSSPLYCEPYFPEAVCQSDTGKAVGLVFRTQSQLAIEIVQTVLAHDIPGLFAFDGWSLCQALVATIAAAGRLWVATGAQDTLVTWHGQASPLQQMTAQLPKSAYHKITLNGTLYWCARKVLPVSPLTGKKAVLVIWQDPIGTGEPFSIITNATWWDATRILATYFQRWPIEEVHRECQPHEGLAQ